VRRTLTLREIEQAERLAGVSVERSGLAAETLRLRFAEMRDARTQGRKNMDSIGETLPSVPHADTAAHAERWGNNHRRRAKEAQRRLVGRAAGKIPYRSRDPLQRSAEDVADLRIVESSRVLALVSARLVSALRRRLTVGQAMP
jgi:hypothetical protein